jgi:hypothetical protein
VYIYTIARNRTWRELCLVWFGRMETKSFRR